ncbi:MAG: rod shape-determining protein MreD [Nitrosomonas sp.]|nr:rod shape-determining protein MreD [Nitrosomonas sp.]
MSVNFPDPDALIPATGWFIFFSLVIALLLNLLPLQGIYLIARPDFVALTILYWSINQPQHLGISIAFLMGLFIDVSNASILGQHAMAYSIVAYIAFILHRRLRIFNPLQQVPQIVLILILMQVIILLTGVIAGADFPGWHFFLASVTGMLTWPIISFILGVLRNPKEDPNTI